MVVVTLSVEALMGMLPYQSVSDVACVRVCPTGADGWCPAAFLEPMDATPAAAAAPPQGLCHVITIAATPCLWL